MIQDEYTRLPDEFAVLADEYANKTGMYIQKADEKAAKKAKRRKKAIMQMMYGRTVTATLFYSVNGAVENNKSEPAYTPEAENYSTVITLPVSEDTEGSNTPDSPIILTDCTDCGGSGIICPGDPNFGLSRGNGHGYAGCGGTGVSACPDINCNGGTYTCPDCHGTGANQYGTCEVCGGRGVYPHEEFCMGLGTMACMTMDSHYQCGKCHGSGKTET